MGERTFSIRLICSLKIEYTVLKAQNLRDRKASDIRGRRHDGIKDTGAINGILDPVAANRFAMTAQGIMKLAHALPKTWGQYGGIRQPLSGSGASVL